MAETPFVRELAERRCAPERQPTRLLSDDPAKALGAAPRQASWLDRLEALDASAAEPQPVSPYFVPTWSARCGTPIRGSDVLAHELWKQRPKLREQVALAAQEPCE